MGVLFCCRAWEVEGGGRAEMLCSPPGVGGTPGARVCHGGYPCEPVSGVHKAGRLTPPSFGPLPLVWRADGLPLLQALPQRESTAPPPPKCQRPQRRKWHCRRHPFPWAHLRPLLDPWEANLLVALWGPPIPCNIPQLTLPARSFKWVKLKGPDKIYICEQCKKPTSNVDSMVSQCLQEHLGIHLVCPQCGMSYSDPSKFCLHGRGVHNLLFY